MGYEEEDALEVPPLNLLGDLAALSALKQVRSQPLQLRRPVLTLRVLVHVIRQACWKGWKGLQLISCSH